MDESLVTSHEKKLVTNGPFVVSRHQSSLRPGGYNLQQPTVFLMNAAVVVSPA